MPAGSGKRKWRLCRGVFPEVTGFHTVSIICCDVLRIGFLLLPEIIAFTCQSRRCVVQSVSITRLLIGECEQFLQIMNSSSIDFRANCMDYIRLWVALSIVYGHSTRWLSVNRAEWFEWVNVFPGLLLLFVLSGFLVTASAEHCSGKLLFLWRRFIRLYPVLWVAFGVSAIAVSIMTCLFDIPVVRTTWSAA